MTKADIVAKVADSTGLTRKEVEVVFDGIIKVISAELADHRHIELRGFGTFKVAVRSPRKAHNPRTGEPVKVERKTKPVFKPSPRLKSMVNSKS